MKPLWNFLYVLLETVVLDFNLVVANMVGKLFDLSVTMIKF